MVSPRAAVAFFGLFGKRNPVEKHAGRAADKRAQAPDRWESIQALGQVIAKGRPAKDKPPPDADAVRWAGEAIQALFPRFGFYVDPSITDQEEKEEVARLLIGAGDLALGPVTAQLRRGELLGWALKILEGIAPADRVVAELLEILATMDTEYERDPIRKVTVLQALEERRDPRVAPAVERFLEDVHEPARYHAVGALFAQPDGEAVRGALTRQIAREESVRVRARLLEGFAERSWEVGAGFVEAGRAKQLPPGFALDKSGVPRKR